MPSQHITFSADGELFQFAITAVGLRQFGLLVPLQYKADTASLQDHTTALTAHITAPLADKAVFFTTASWAVHTIDVVATSSSRETILCTLPVSLVPASDAGAELTLGASTPTPLSDVLVSSWFKMWQQQQLAPSPMVGQRRTKLSLPSIVAFRANLRKIVDHHIQTHASAEPTYTLRLNRWAGTSWEDFKATMGIPGLTAPQNVFSTNGSLESFSLPPSAASAGINIKTSLDWEGEGFVTSVQSQGKCGGCWAFSATAALESTIALESGCLLKLSEQQLISCDTIDKKCKGGAPSNAYKWLGKNAPGACIESQYPYTSGGGKVAACSEDTHCTRYVNYTHGMSFELLTQGSRDALMAAMAVQPVAVAMTVNSKLQFYSDGVFTDACDDKINHGVLLVGYGKESGTKYWRIKNSWSKLWGEDGYFRLERGKDQKNGLCGILKQSIIPVLNLPASFKQMDNATCKALGGDPVTPEPIPVPKKTIYDIIMFFLPNSYFNLLGHQTSLREFVFWCGVVSIFMILVTMCIMCSQICRYCYWRRKLKRSRQRVDEAHYPRGYAPYNKMRE